LIGQEKLDAMRAEAPKGLVQIARYFGNENLRPDLEKARARMVNLVSLNLEVVSGGDLRAAAHMLRDHSLLSRSKGGSDMLKALVTLPQNSHFGMNERTPFTDEHIALLAKWSLKTVADYRAELALRSQAARVVDAAVWLADQLGLPEDELEDAGKDAEAVIRTSLLALAAGLRKMPDWQAFEKMVLTLRKANTAPTGTPTPPAKKLKLTLPKGLPDEWTGVVESVRRSVTADLLQVLDPSLAPRQLFDRSPAFMGRYFWIEDGLAEVDQYDRVTGDAWDKLTGGHTDDGSLLTLLVCVAVGSAPTTLLSEKAATALVKKIGKTGFKPELARRYIAEHAPAQYHDSYQRLWAAFANEAAPVLTSDAVHAANDAVALLRRECNVELQARPKPVKKAAAQHKPS
jgi:hypothetical protein